MGIAFFQCKGAVKRRQISLSERDGIERSLGSPLTRYSNNSVFGGCHIATATPLKVKKNISKSILFLILCMESAPFIIKINKNAVKSTSFKLNE